MVDERTGMKFSDFFEKRNGMIEPTCAQWNIWKNAGLVTVKFVRLDNAGESNKLKERSESDDWKLNIENEFTARDTPQQNHLDELGFAVLANRGRALMYRANIPEREQYRLFKEAFKMAMLLDALMVIEIDGKKQPRIVHRSRKLPEYAKNLRTWGEAGTVKLRNKMTPKIADRGAQCMMVGYATDHAGDVYWMWDAKTNHVHETRDVIWLKRMYFEKPNKVKEITTPLQIDVGDEVKNKAYEMIEVGEGDNNDDDDEVIDLEEEDVPENEAEDIEDADAGTTTRSGRIIVRPERFRQEIGATTTTNSEPYEIRLMAAEARYYDTMWQLGETALVGAGIGGGFIDTSELHVMKYQDAMKQSDANEWKKTMDEEHERMLKHKVWQPVPMKDLHKVDNKSVIDLANNWSVGGRTRHIVMRANFLRELKEEGLLRVEWIPTNLNSVDLFTKNLQGPLFNEHASVYVTREDSTNSQREGVGAKDSIMRTRD